jgi:hypothetical protein
MVSNHQTRPATTTRYRQLLKSKEPFIARTCQHPGCENAALTAHLFCERHATTPEGVSYYREIQAAAAALLDTEYTDATGNDALLRRENAERFTQRLKQGKFTRLLDATVTKVLQQAAAEKSYQLEIGALRYAIAEETDVHRLSLAIARLANAMARLALAEYGTRDPKPVVRYGQEWEPPLPGGEKLVHYIWRHRPADFEERYMAKIDDPDSLPWNIDRHVEADYRDSLEPGRVNTTPDGKYLPPPLPEWRRATSRAGDAAKGPSATAEQASGRGAEADDNPERGSGNREIAPHGAWAELYEAEQQAG